jgi:hypothetical protein
MGVITTFDEKIKEAKEALTTAVKALMICVDESTWGIDDKKSSYVDDLYQVIAELAKLKRKL